MKQEDLFRAIGELESLRLAKTEEDLPMKSGMKLTRRLLIAAVVTALLAGSAYAAHYFLFDSPKEMVTGLYGSDASLAPSEASDEQKPWPNSYVLPGYDKRPVDETTAQVMEGWISPVGQTLKNGGYQLTVDAYVYDSAMKAGFVTLALEHDKPIAEADLMMQRNGEIIPGMVEFTQYGRCYIIPEKTTDTTLAMTYYFSSGVRDSHVFAITLLDHDEQKRILEESSRDEQERSAYIAQRREALMAEMTLEEAQAKLMEQSGFSGGEAPYDAYYYLAANEYDWNYASSHPQQTSPEEEAEARLRRELTPEEAEAKLREIWGDEAVDATFQDRPEDIAELAYFILAEEEVDATPQENKLILPMPEDSALPNRSFGGGDVLVNSLCLRVNDEKYNPGGSADVQLRMKDGSVFVVCSDEMNNCLFQKGEWDGTCLCMLNSAINIEDIETVILTVKGQEIVLAAD